MSDFAVLDGPRSFLPQPTLPWVAAMTVLALGALACSSQARLAAPTVVANGEHLVGAYVGEGTAEAVFQGIPYAAPPVGELRWKPPAPITPRPGVQQATKFGPSCVQEVESTDFYRYIAETLGQDPNLVPRPGPSSENCLYLNVWTPNLGGKKPHSRDGLDSRRRQRQRHRRGGCRPTERTSRARASWSCRINYRLNLFGFLAHPALTAESEHGSSGNYALLDQIAALQWVQQNAAAFGGDPGRVTVFGESAGGTNITYLLASPLSRGLFHRAVIESGGYAVSDFRTLARGGGGGQELRGGARRGGLEGRRSRPCARLPPRISAAPGSASGSSAPTLRTWTAGCFRRRPPGRSTGASSTRCPCSSASTRTSGRPCVHYWPNVTLDDFRQVLRAVYGPLADRAMELYPATTDAEAVAAADRWQTDWYYVGPSRFIAERTTRAGAPAYVYVFSRCRQVPGGEKLGAHHAIEIPYVWDTLAAETVDAAPALRPGARRRDERGLGALRGHRRSERRRSADLAALPQRGGGLPRVRRHDPRRRRHPPGVLRPVREAPGVVVGGPALTARRDAEGTSDGREHHQHSRHPRVPGLHHRARPARVAHHRPRAAGGRSSRRSFSDLNVLDTLTGPYMTGFTNYARRFYLIFLMGTLFGKFMEDSGAARSIAHAIMKLIGGGADKPLRVLVAFSLVPMALTYGGVSLFVVIFTVLPIARHLWQEADIPWHLFMLSFVFGAASMTMTMIPGTPQIQNIMPTKYMNSTPASAPVLGLLGAARRLRAQRPLHEVLRRQVQERRRALRSAERCRRDHRDDRRAPETCPTSG